MDLKKHSKLMIRQRRELAELFGFETRNKYEITDEQKNVIGFAAEQQKGIFGFLFRQYLGHWRRFDLHIFDSNRQPLLIAKHPFRFIFQRMELFTFDGRYLGAIQQRFAILKKRLDVEAADGRVILEMSSPFWKIWTFPFRVPNAAGSAVSAQVNKKWSGLLNEAFTDKDNFVIDFADPGLNNEEKQLVLAAGIMIDLKYFEYKAS